MEENKNKPCDLFVLYISGECDDEERISFENHLQSCPSCQEEMKDFKQVWHAMPWQMEIVEAPADLKVEVMGAIFQQPSYPNGIPMVSNGSSKEKPTTRLGLSKAWSVGIAAAVAALVILGSAWNFNLVQQQKATLNQALNQPANVEVIYSLNATSAGSKANGKACILKQGNNSMLVVYLYGLAATRGKEAYQVWLIENGQRRNAGTFLVDEKGLGVLTYELTETQRSFDSIGVTLEPDSNGTEPRGKKVVGTPT